VQGGSTTLLLRGIGPGLTPFGVTGVLSDPRLEIFFGPTPIAINDNWSPQNEPSRRN